MRALLLFLFSCSSALAQYAPSVGLPGTTAIPKDSIVFVAWATGSSVEKGYQDISDHSFGYANVGDSNSVIGIAGTSGIVSLGDGGNAVVRFLHPIVNGPSWDFAVFENGFDDSFLELAFVEVSSDGTNFYRFPASSLTDTSVQTGSFSSTDPQKVNNLAGKYRALYGTPFDLNEMTGISGLDVNDIHFVKIVDVVGSVQEQYASYDTAGRAVNDPWPTSFGSSGFDLDAVGVIHQNPLIGMDELSAEDQFDIYPNPCKVSDKLSFVFHSNDKMKSLIIYSLNGEKLINSSSENVDISILSSGMYIAEVITEKGKTIHKKIIIQ